ncbi:MAG: hypothetical protein U1F23_03815 [Lysobacterales bacterium]
MHVADAPFEVGGGIDPATPVEPLHAQQRGPVGRDADRGILSEAVQQVVDGGLGDAGDEETRFAPRGVGDRRDAGKEPAPRRSSSSRRAAMRLALARSGNGSENGLHAVRYHAQGAAPIHARSGAGAGAPIRMFATDPSGSSTP